MFDILENGIELIYRNFTKDRNWNYKYGEWLVVRLKWRVEFIRWWLVSDDKYVDCSLV